jgi:hypothetical protein
LLCYGGVLDADSLPLHTSSPGGCSFGFRVTARHGSGRRRGVGVHGPSRMTACGGVVEDAGSAVARPAHAPESHGSLVLGVVVAPLVSDGFLLARPSSTSTSARRRPASLPARWRSTRHDTGGSARWRLAPAPLHGRPSLLLLLSDGAQEGEKIPRWRRTQEQVAADGFYRWRLGFGRARVAKMQHGAHGSHLRTPAQQGAAPWASPGERCGLPAVACARDVSKRKGKGE